MKTSKTAIQLVLPALILALVSVTFGQVTTAPNQSPDTTTTTRTRSVADREQFKIEGIVTKRDGNVLTLVGSDQNELGVKFFNLTNHFNPRDFQNNLASDGFGKFSNGVGRKFWTRITFVKK